MLRINLKMELLKRYGTQSFAAQHLGIHEKRLSDLVRGRANPTDGETQTLRTALNMPELYQVEHLLKVDAGMSD